MINACSRVPQWWIFLKVKHNSYKHILGGGGLGFNLIVGLETELHLWFKIISLLWWMPDSVATRLERVEVTQAEASSMAAESLQAVPWGLKALGLGRLPPYIHMCQCQYSTDQGQDILLTVGPAHLKPNNYNMRSMFNKWDLHEDQNLLIVLMLFFIWKTKYNTKFLAIHAYSMWKYIQSKRSGFQLKLSGMLFDDIFKDKISCETFLGHLYNWS